MLPQTHFVFGFIFAGIILAIVPSIGILGFLLIVLSTVLMDVDHYVYYVAKKRNLSLIKAYRWFKAKGEKFNRLSIEEKNKTYRAFCFLHGLEIPIILLISTFLVSEYFGFVFIGTAFHLLLDYYEQWVPGLRKDKISAISDFLKFRKLRYLE